MRRLDPVEEAELCRLEGRGEEKVAQKLIWREEEAMGAPFARLLANIVVMGGGVLGRAFLDAYKQALSERHAA